MYLEIVSPEATLFQGEIEALSVPGTQGSFQVLIITQLSYQHLLLVRRKFKGK